MTIKKRTNRVSSIEVEHMCEGSRQENDDRERLKNIQNGIVRSHDLYTNLIDFNEFTCTLVHVNSLKSGHAAWASVTCTGIAQLLYLV